MLIRAASSKEAIISVEQKRVISQDSSNAKEETGKRTQKEQLRCFVFVTFLFAQFCIVEPHCFSGGTQFEVLQWRRMKNLI